MPRPLPSIISSNKSHLVSIFSRYLLSKRYGHTISDPISKSLIEDVIIHKSFGAAFTYEIRSLKMKPRDVSAAINNLIDNIYIYFTKPALTSQADYDSWECKIGNMFLADCSSYMTFQFGKAQKIINVTMKHLYCYNVSEKYFEYCHVALDSMTYTGRPSNSLDGGFYKFEVDPTAIAKSFSNLSYTEYMEIQTNIRNYLRGSVHLYRDSSTGVSLNPFKAEFYIWPRYKR